MSKKLFLSSLLSALLLQDIIFADDLDMDLDGFDTEETLFDEPIDEADVENREVEKEISPLAIGGSIAFKTAYGYRNHKVDGVEYEGFNQSQISFSAELDYKISKDWKLRIEADTYYDAIYDLRTKTDYNDDVLDAYHTDIMLKDSYIQGSLSDDLDLKVGRQIVVWGKSDSIRITDVINPLDNRTPGMTDIEDLRLSVGMAKFDYYVGSWNISAMLIGENRIMIEAPQNSEFFPIDTGMDLKKPDYDTDNLQYALAFNGIFSGWDLSFYGANVLDSKWHIDTVTKTREVSTIGMLGSAINIATGSWLLKSEVAFLSGIKYNSTTDEKNRLDMLVGFDYMGIKNTVLSLEVADRHIFDYEDKMNSKTEILKDYTDQDEVQTAIRASRTFLNESIEVTTLVSMFGTSFENGGFVRVWSEIDIIDGVTSNVGVVDYVGGDNFFMDKVKDNDRVFADITYSF